MLQHLAELVFLISDYNLSHSLHVSKHVLHQNPMHLQMQCTEESGIASRNVIKFWICLSVLPLKKCRKIIYYRVKIFANRNERNCFAGWQINFLHSHQEAEADAKDEGVVEDETCKHEIQHHLAVTQRHGRDGHAQCWRHGQWQRTGKDFLVK